MKDIQKKIKLIFVPYLIISLATLIGWTFLHWLLFIKLKIYPVNEFILTVVIPLVIAYIVYLLWIRKVLKLLKLKSETGRISMLYVFVSMFTIGIQSLFAQQYIEEAAGSLTQLTSINEIEKKEVSRYYTLKHFYLDKKNFSFQKKQKYIRSSSSFTGQNLKMLTYFAVPIFNSAKDTFGKDCVAWYCLRYKETVGKNYDEKKDVKEFNSFVNKKMINFQNLDLNQFEFLERIQSTDGIYDNLLETIKTNKKYNTNSNIILMPHTETFENRGNEDLRNTLMIFGGGTLLFFIMLLFVNLKDSENKSELINL